MAKLKQETIAAQIGNRKCERTGAVNMPVYFSTAYQHADLGVSTGMIILELEIRREMLYRKRSRN